MYHIESKQIEKKIHLGWDLGAEVQYGTQCMAIKGCAIPLHNALTKLQTSLCEGL